MHVGFVHSTLVDLRIVTLHANTCEDNMSDDSQTEQIHEDIQVKAHETRAKLGSVGQLPPPRSLLDWPPSPARCLIAS
jgi:hypothetical protein